MALQLKELKELIIHVAGAANEQVCTPCEIDSMRADWSRVYRRYCKLLLLWPSSE